MNNEQNYQYLCDKCDVVFGFLEGLQAHKVTSCPHRAIDSSADQDSDVEPMSLSSDASFEEYYVPEDRDTAHMEEYVVEREYGMCDHALNRVPEAGKVEDDVMEQFRVVELEPVLKPREVLTTIAEESFDELEDSVNLIVTSSSNESTEAMDLDDTSESSEDSDGSSPSFTDSNDETDSSVHSVNKELEHNEEVPAHQLESPKKPAYGIFESSAKQEQGAMNIAFDVKHQEVVIIDEDTDGEEEYVSEKEALSNLRYVFNNSMLSEESLEEMPQETSGNSIITSSPDQSEIATDSYGSSSCSPKSNVVYEPHGLRTEASKNTMLVEPNGVEDSRESDAPIDAEGDFLDDEQESAHAPEEPAGQEEQGEVAPNMDVVRRNFFENIFATGQLHLKNFTGKEHQMIREIIKENLHSINPINFPYLLLENNGKHETEQTQCFMNTIINLLYSCMEFRQMIQESAQDQSKTILTSIFQGMFSSGRLWRFTLDPSTHSGQKDIHTIFEMLADGLRKKLDIRMMQIRTETELKCRNCQASRTRSKGVQESTVLNIINGSFMDSLERFCKPEPYKECDKCGGLIFKTRIIQPIGKYLFFLTNIPSKPLDPTKPDDQDRLGYIQDLDWTSVIPMFASSWRIRSIAERKDFGANGGHFMARVRVQGHQGGEHIVRINDPEDTLSCEPLAKINIKIIVFEKI